METRIPVPVPLFRLEPLDGQLLLYHPGLTRTVHLNEEASLVWRLCDGRRSNQEIVRLLQETYPEEAHRIADDVEATLRRLEHEGAIEFA